VKINRHTRLLAPGNHSNGAELNFQVIQTDRISDQLLVKNTTIVSYTRRNTLSTYYYNEVIAPSEFGENRTEFVFTSHGK
jgi:catecholate siderophore receptor